MISTKIRILSDLHNEFGEFEYGDVGEDVIVLAGDVDIGTKGARWAATLGKPIIYVAGNHEHYRQDLQQNLQSLDTERGVYFLEKSVAFVAGIRFVGCTLWTDFLLYNNPLHAMMAQRMMNDYRFVYLQDRRLCARDTQLIHAASRRFLETVLAEPSTFPTVVVTHHGPTPLSTYPDNDPINAAYTSDLTALVAGSGAVLWIHGHTHRSHDYQVGETRVLVNPRGYYPDGLNRDFDRDLVVTVQRRT